jgi:hypothetical protein
MNLTQKAIKGVLIMTAALAVGGITSMVTGSVIKNIAEKDYKKAIQIEQTINEDYFNSRKKFGNFLENLGSYAIGGAISFPIWVYLTADLSGKKEQGQ